MLIINKTHPVHLQDGFFYCKFLLENKIFITDQGIYQSQTINSFSFENMPKIFLIDAFNLKNVF